jgi:hypothetical protein
MPRPSIPPEKKRRQLSLKQYTDEIARLDELCALLDCSRNDAVAAAVAAHLKAVKRRQKRS